MEYITAAETATKWGVSLRQVQRLLAAGRIPGGKKHGHEYLIPANATRPYVPRSPRSPLLKGGDGRAAGELSASPKSLSDELDEVHAAIPLSMPLDNPDAVLDMVSFDHLRVIPEIHLAYLRGDFERVKRAYDEISGNGVVKLTASGTAIAAAISLGDYPFFLEVEAYLKNIVREDVSANVTAYAEFSLAIAYIGAVANNMVPEWLINGDFNALPGPIKTFAAYERVTYLSQQKNPEAMLAAAQAYLSLCACEHGITYPDTYLRIHCAEACLALEREDDAKTYLRSALEKNLPHGFITPFAERLIILGGLCERLLESEFPAHHDAVIGQFERVTKNWLVFHNRFTKNNITHILSLRDYQIARLAAQGLSNKKIADRFYVSEKRLIKIKSEICAKLFITEKSTKARDRELAKYVL